jgi:hypothetical protein
MRISQSKIGQLERPIIEKAEITNSAISCVNLKVDSIYISESVFSRGQIEYIEYAELGSRKNIAASRRIIEGHKGIFVNSRLDLKSGGQSAILEIEDYTNSYEHGIQNLYNYDYRTLEPHPIDWGYEIFDASIILDTTKSYNIDRLGDCTIY